MSNIKLNDILQDILSEAAEEKTYKVSFEFRTGKFGDDIDGDTVEVQATSEEEAIKTVQNDPIKYKIPRLVMSSSWKAELKK